MTLRMQRVSGEWGTRIYLSGELRSQQLDDLRAEIEHCGPGVIVDLDEVDVVDIDAVRFLSASEARDVEVVNCLPYIREWMFQERAIENRRQGKRD